MDDFDVCQRGAPCRRQGAAQQPQGSQSAAIVQRLDELMRECREDGHRPTYRDLLHVRHGGADVRADDIHPGVALPDQEQRDLATQALLVRTLAGPHCYLRHEGDGQSGSFVETTRGSGNAVYSERQVRQLVKAIEQRYTFLRVAAGSRGGAATPAILPAGSLTTEL